MVRWLGTISLCWIILPGCGDGATPGDKPAADSDGDLLADSAADVPAASEDADADATPVDVAPLDLAPDVAAEDAPADVLAPDVPADLAEEDVPPDVPDVATKFHPANWMVKADAGFHGTAAKQGLTTCMACHGAQLDGGTAKVSCNACHSGWQTNCTFCHGGLDNKTGAPPINLAGLSETTLKGVGAHTTHVTAGKFAGAFDCTACHTKPTSALSPDHVKPGPAVVIATAGWDATAVTCTNACHGAFPGGNAANHPKWTQVDGTQAQCGTCHVLPPKTGRHPANFAKHSSFKCSICHDGLVDDEGTALLTLDKHVNGIKDVVFKLGGTWNAASQTCSPACHGPKDW